MTYSFIDLVLKRVIVLIEILQKVKSRIQLWRDNARRQIGIFIFDKEKIPLNKNNHLVIVRWDAKLGDAIVSSWFLREVKNNNPSMWITVITTESMADLFKRFFFADEVITIEKRPSYARLNMVANQLGDVEYLIHLGKKLKMKDIYFISKVKANHVVGLDDELDSVDIKVGRETEGVHFSDKFMSILNKMDMQPLSEDYVVPYFYEDEIIVSSQWKCDDKLVCFNPYGSGNARRLNRENIIKISRMLVDVFQTKVFILFPPDKASEAKDIVDTIRSDVFIFSDNPTIGCMIAQIRHCSLLVSVDTATIHIASGLNKPTLAIYNPDMENYQEWGPKNNKARVVFSNYKDNLSVNNIDFCELNKSLVEFKNDID